jgi:hypothetical protein
MVLSNPSHSLLDCESNNSQIFFNNASTAGFDNTHNMALNLHKDSSIILASAFFELLWSKNIHILRQH